MKVIQWSIDWLVTKSRHIAIQNIEKYKDTPIYLILQQRQNFATKYLDWEITRELFLEYLELQDLIIAKEFNI